MSHEHYFRDVSGLDQIDVYRILDLFGVTCPIAQHVVKKALVAGQRGHKSNRRDWQDIADSAGRKLQMLDEDMEALKRAGLFGGSGVHALADTMATNGAGKPLEAAQNAASAVASCCPNEQRSQDAEAEDEAFAAIEASQPRIDSGPVWVEWRGESSDAPCHSEQWVEVELRDGDIDKGRAGGFRWIHQDDAGDIVAWSTTFHDAQPYHGEGGVMIKCPGCTAQSCECRP